MPGMEDPELVRRLKECRPGLRVLFVSGYDEGRFVLDAPEGARRAFLPKLSTLDALAREIRSVLDPGVG